MMVPFKAAIAAILLFSASASQALTYVGTRQVGTATATITLVTDGTIGPIREANLLDMRVVFSQFGSTRQLERTGNIFLYFPGTTTGLEATQTNISFNADGRGLLFLADNFIQTFYCINGTAGQCSGNGVRNEVIALNAGIPLSSTPTGLVELGRATTGAIPEPASWAMLIAGFGLVGATLRHRRRLLA